MNQRKPETAHVDSQKMCNSLTAKYEAAQPKKAHKPQSESTESREVISDSNPKATQTTAQQLKSVSVEADD